MTETHEPTSEFVSRLEWQVRSTLSRRDRFSMPTRRPTQQVVKVAALILISVFLGAAGVATADQVQESRARAILLQQIDLEMQLAGVQLQYLRTRIAEIQDLFDTGQAHEDVLVHAKLELRRSELRYTRLQIDREEIELTGREPQQTVSAPLVGERDFVTERLDLELSMAARERELAQEKMKDADRLFAAGVVDNAVLQQQEVELANTMQHLTHLLEFQNLRALFLAGEISAEIAEQKVKLAEAESQLDYSALERARRGLIRIEELFEQGAVRESEVYEIRLEVIERELRTQQIALMIENLRAALQEVPPPQ